MAKAKAPASSQRMPDMLPPAQVAGAGQERPTELTEDQIKGLSSNGGGGNGSGIANAPTMTPPQEARQVRESVTAWQTNKKIVALWSDTGNRNSWIYIDGVGWKKLVNTSDSSIMTLTALAAHAKQLGSLVNYREEADGMIYELYVW